MARGLDNADLNNLNLPDSAGMHPVNSTNVKIRKFFVRQEEDFPSGCLNFVRVQIIVTKLVVVAKQKRHVNNNSNNNNNRNNNSSSNVNSNKNEIDVIISAIKKLT